MSGPTTAEQSTGGTILSVRRRNLVFVAVLLGMLLASLNQTIVATALPTVVADLGGAGHQAWVVTSYLLASTVVTAVGGKVGDIFGRKIRQHVAHAVAGAAAALHQLQRLERSVLRLERMNVQTLGMLKKLVNAVKKTSTEGAK